MDVTVRGEAQGEPDSSVTHISEPLVTMGALSSKRNGSDRPPR